MLSRFTTSSFRAARPQPPPCSKMPMSISSPKCQCQSPRQNANVNLIAKLPMSIPSPKCTTHEPLTPSPSFLPRADLIQNCPTLGILRPLYFLGLDSHSALPISAQKYEHSTNALVPPTKTINLIFQPPFSPSASPATFSKLRMRTPCWALARDSPRSR